MWRWRVKRAGVGGLGRKVGKQVAGCGVGDAVGRGDDHVATGVAVLCGQVVCMGIAGIAAATRNVLLGVIGGVRGMEW